MIMSKRKYRNPKKGYQDLSPYFKKFFARFGFYKLDDMGKPYYQNTKEGKTMRVTAPNKLKEMKDGATEARYGKVKLKTADGSFKNYYTHRLQGRFISNPESKPLIHHDTGKKNHNGIDELQWATYKENATYREQRKKGDDVI